MTVHLVGGVALLSQPTVCGVGGGVGAPASSAHPVPPSQAEPPPPPCLQDSLPSPHRYPQVSEGPVLILQPSSGLHFPAIETLREMVLSRALESTCPRGLQSPPAPCCPLCTPAWLLLNPKTLPRLLGRSLPTFRSRGSRACQTDVLRFPSVCSSGLSSGSWYLGEKGPFPAL